uniref:Uncharacterized protein n=1 Tax=Meloidogyne javanica TaxID=6303 RepID=A0A915MAE8_MELJA
MPFPLVIGASIIVQSLPFFLLLVPSVLTNCCKRKKRFNGHSHSTTISSISTTDEHPNGSDSTPIEKVAKVSTANKPLIQQRVIALNTSGSRITPVSSSSSSGSKSNKSLKPSLIKLKEQRREKFASIMEEDEDWDVSKDAKLAIGVGVDCGTIGNPVRNFKGSRPGIPGLSDKRITGINPAGHSLSPHCLASAASHLGNQQSYPNLWKPVHHESYRAMQH